MPRCTIPRHRGAVKGRPRLGHGSSFPEVLQHLPSSAFKVFGVLLLSSADGTVTIPLRLLAHRAGISPTQARRALKRLVAVNLLEVVEHGRGRKATVFRLRWDLPYFPHPFVPSSPTPPSQGTGDRTPSETTASPKGAAWSDLPIKSQSSALRWLMFRLRREIERWALPPPRRERLLRAAGAAVWRALKRGYLRTTAAVRRFWWALLSRLRDAREGISRDLKQACGFAGWCVLVSLRELGFLGSHRGSPVETVHGGERAGTMVECQTTEVHGSGGLRCFQWSPK